MDKKNTNFGGISSALLRENFKQQWYVPALLFILYFLSGIFPVLMMDRESRGYYAQTSLANNNFFFGVFIVFVPLVTACIMIRYYHRADMAFALNSQPYSRGKLFNTNILSGWIFMVLPVVLTGLIYMAVSGSIETPIYGNGIIGWEQAYTVKTALMWIVESISLYTFYYGLCILAGSLVGNTVTQILGSLVFYGLVPALAGIFLLFSEYCLPGYSSSSEAILKVIMYSQPILGGLLSSATEIVLPDRIWYLVAGLLLILIAKFICNRAKLEKVGDSMIFRPVEAVVTVVITFIGGAILGLLFGYVFDNSLGMFLLGAFVGAAISFFLVKIILARSIRIFNKTNLKTFIAALVITFLFISSFVMDVTGFGRRVPGDSDIASVNVKGVSENILMLNSYDIYDEEGFYIKNKVFTEDEEFISKVTELHQYIADNKLYDFKGSENAPSMEVRLEYVLKNGKTFERFFNIRVDEKAEELLRDIANDKAMDEVMLIPEALKNGATRADIEIQIWKNDEDVEYHYGEIPGSGREDIARFIDLYNEDRKDDVITEVANKYEEYVPDETYDKPVTGEALYAYVNIYYKSTNSDAYDHNPNESYEPCVRIGVGRDDEKTFEFIKELCEKYPADY